MVHGCHQDVGLWAIWKANVIQVSDSNLNGCICASNSGLHLPKEIDHPTPVNLPLVHLLGLGPALIEMDHPGRSYLKFDAIM